MSQLIYALEEGSTVGKRLIFLNNITSLVVINNTLTFKTTTDSVTIIKFKTAEDAEKEYTNLLAFLNNNGCQLFNQGDVLVSEDEIVYEENIK